MFAKLKKKIQDESQNIVVSPEESEKKSSIISTTSPTCPTGPGLASPVCIDYPASAMFSHTFSDSLDMSSKMDNEFPNEKSKERYNMDNDFTESNESEQSKEQVKRLLNQMEYLENKWIETEESKKSLTEKVICLQQETELMIEQKQKHQTDILQYEKKMSIQELGFREQLRQLKDQLDMANKASDRDKIIAQENLAILERDQQNWLEREIDMERQITRLEEDLQIAKKSLSDKQQELHKYIGKLQQKEGEIEALETEIIKRNEKLQEFHLSGECLERTVSSLQEEITACINEKNAVLVRNAQLSQEFESLKRRSNQQVDDTKQEVAQQDEVIAKLNESLEKSQEERWLLEEKLKNIQSQQDDIVHQVETEEINHLKKQLKLYVDQLTEKNKTIKMLQQRITDLKKTLQRELKVQSLPNDEVQDTPAPSVNKDAEVINMQQTNIHPQKKSEEISCIEIDPASISVPETPHKHSNLENKHPVHSRLPNTTYLRPYPPDVYQSTLPASDIAMSSEYSSHQSHIHGSRKKKDQHDVNFEYLKHVVLKFMLSRENEAIHLIRAVSMLLHFSPEEQQLIHETLEWKMSWFRSKPQLGKGQLSKVVPSTFY